MALSLGKECKNTGNYEAECICHEKAQKYTKRAEDSEIAKQSGQF
jgi:hypothetical protein